MKKINDSKLYRNTSIVMLLIGLILGAISYYSVWFVEPEIKELLQKGSDIKFLANDSSDVKEKKIIEANKYYKKAYVKLRDPQIFARYEEFDQKSKRIKIWITQFDQLVYEGRNFREDAYNYLNIFFERREQGAALGRITMAFFFLLSLAAFVFYLTERKFRKKA